MRTNPIPDFGIYPRLHTRGPLLILDRMVSESTRPARGLGTLLISSGFNHPVITSITGKLGKQVKITY